MLLLHLSRCNVMFAHAPPFFRRRFVADAARTACVCYAPIIHNRRIVNDCLVDISVMKPSPHMHDGRVVEEMAAAPFAAGKANAHIAEAIVHAAIIANVGPPISGMKEVMSTL